MNIPKRLRAALLGAVVLAAAGATAAGAAVSNGDTGSSNYHAVTSYRLLDTRTSAALAPNTPHVLTVADTDGVPATGVTSVTVNLTVTAPKTSGYLVVWADGAARPVPASNVNFNAGQTAANQATVPVTDGKIDLENVSGGAAQAVVDLVGYSAAAPAAYTPPQSTWSATSSVLDHPDSGNDGGNWAVDTITRTASITLKGASDVSNCGSGATSCYLYGGSIADTGSFTTASSADVATDGKSPNASADINGTETGLLTGGSAVQFYASSDTPTGTVAANVSGVVSGEQTTTNWVEQFFPAGTSFGAGPDLLNWNWTYTTLNTCEKWVDAYNVETAESGDIAGVNGCPVG